MTMRIWIGVVVLWVGLAGSAIAGDAVGAWQGVLRTGDSDLRTVLQISKEPNGHLNCRIFSIDQGPDPFPCSAISVDGTKLSLKFADIGGSYEGSLEARGQRIEGVWKQEATWPLTLVRATTTSAWPIDPSPHRVRFVTTSDHVKLEVLDWGGEGPPLVLLASAHAFDTFALKLRGKHHIYAITRRGYGGSERPDPAIAGYSADRLGEDVLDVIESLKLDRPVLAGWSIGGEELSSIASRRPEKVGAVIYLDAAYAYSFYAPGNQLPTGANLNAAVNSLRDKIRAVNRPGVAPQEAAALIDVILKTDLPQLQTDLEATRKTMGSRPPPSPSETGPPQPETQSSRIWAAIIAGEQKYTELKTPTLAIFAIQPLPPASASEAEQEIARGDAAAKQDLIANFAAGNPNARVVQIKNAEHAVFASNSDDVVREIDGFLEELKSRARP